MEWAAENPSIFAGASSATSAKAGLSNNGRPAREQNTRPGEHEMGKERVCITVGIAIRAVRMQTIATTGEQFLRSRGPAGAVLLPEGSLTPVFLSPKVAP